MAKELTGLGKFTIWALVPALIGVLGYRVVGPNIGGIGAKAPALRKIGQKIATGVGRTPSAPPSGGAASSPAPAPTSSTPAGSAPSPTSSGATEFQRIREAQPNRPAPRRSSIDRVDN